MDGNELRGINLLVVGTAEGEPGNLLGALTNETQEDASFTLETPAGSPVTVDVPADTGPPPGGAEVAADTATFLLRARRLSAAEAAAFETRKRNRG